MNELEKGTLEIFRTHKKPHTNTIMRKLKVNFPMAEELLAWGYHRQAREWFLRRSEIQELIEEIG
jgi:hypothetical protein